MLLHGLSGPGVGELTPIARFHAVVRGFDRVVGDISGPEELIESAGRDLPRGAAHAEAVAVRLRRRGVQLSWAGSRQSQNRRELLRLCYLRGRSSIDIARTDPSLVSELQIGRWFDAGWRMRLLRRLMVATPGLRATRLRATLWFRLLAEVEFWRGVRAAATAKEWRRLTRSSYVALGYHRFAGELKPGQEKYDTTPATFERQLRLLRSLRFRHLRAEEVLAFHEGESPTLPPRSFVITVDDGLADCAAPLLRNAALGIQLFVPTGELGGSAHWFEGEPVLTWEGLRELHDAGVAVGAHTRHHRALQGLDAVEQASELAGSRRDLCDALESPVEIVAYPYGIHDATVVAAAAESGFRAAFTTKIGRNGAGIDRYSLRRVTVHGADGALAVLWKVVTGEGLPVAWQRARNLRRNAAAAIRERGRHAVRGGIRLLFVPALRAVARARLNNLRAGEVTVVTVNWNSRPYLEVLLRLVRRRSPENVRILVIDNGSKDSSRTLLAQEQDVKAVRLPMNIGHELALDIGFLLAGTEYVVALDVDAFPLHDRWLEELLAPLGSGYEISGARLNREYVHPCCFAMRTERFVSRRHSFRSKYRRRADGRDASGDVGETISLREPGRLYFFEPTSQRGPGDTGTVFGDLVYHNFYATRFQATREALLDELVARSDPRSAWREAVRTYDI